jgi:hypothetical protein
LVLVSQEQFSQLVKEINTLFPRLHIDPKDPYYREIGLTINFNFQHPRFRPRYLGCSKSREQYDNLLIQAPGLMSTRKDEPDPKTAADDHSREVFRTMVEKSIANNKAKNKADKEARRFARLEKQKDMDTQLKRAQCCLGLRPEDEKGES